MYLYPSPRELLLCPDFPTFLPVNAGEILVYGSTRSNLLSIQN